MLPPGMIRVHWMSKLYFYILSFAFVISVQLTTIDNWFSWDWNNKNHFSGKSMWSVWSWLYLFCEVKAKTYLWYSSTCYVVDDEICSDRLMFVTDFFSSSVTKGFFLFSSVNISIEVKFYFMWMVYVFRWWTKFCFKYNWVSVKNVCRFRLLSCSIRSVDTRLTKIIYNCINPNKTVQKSVVINETVFMASSYILFHLSVTKSLIIDLLLNRLGTTINSFLVAF